MTANGKGSLNGHPLAAACYWPASSLMVPLAAECFRRPTPPQRAPWRPTHPHGFGIKLDPFPVQPPGRAKSKGECDAMAADFAGSLAIPSCGHCVVSAQLSSSRIAMIHFRAGRGPRMDENTDGFVPLFKSFRRGRLRGAGFSKPCAITCTVKGLKFGHHIMRGNSRAKAVGPRKSSVQNTIKITATRCRRQDQPWAHGGMEDPMASIMSRSLELRPITTP